MCDAQRRGRMIRAAGMTGRNDCSLARDVAKPMPGLFGWLGICAFKESSTSYCGQQTAQVIEFFEFSALRRDERGLANANGCATRCEYCGFDVLVLCPVRDWTGGLWLCTSRCAHVWFVDAAELWINSNISHRADSGRRDGTLDNHHDSRVMSKAYCALQGASRPSSSLQVPDRYDPTGEVHELPPSVNLGMLSRNLKPSREGVTRSFGSHHRSCD